MGFFRTDGEGWSCAGSRDGAWVKPGVAQVVCRDGQGSVTRPIREYGGEIFTDYYFGEANTANKSDNHHINAINKKLNWGGISGLLQLATTNSGSRPEIQDGLGGKGGKKKRETTKNSTPPTRTRLHVDDELLSRR